MIPNRIQHLLKLIGNRPVGRFSVALSEFPVEIPLYHTPYYTKKHNTRGANIYTILNSTKFFNLFFYKNVQSFLFVKTRSVALVGDFFEIGPKFVCSRWTGSSKITLFYRKTISKSVQFMRLFTQNLNLYAVLHQPCNGASRRKFTLFDRGLHSERNRTQPTPFLL